jgi:hypothetical protein
LCERRRGRRREVREGACIGAATILQCVQLAVEKEDAKTFLKLAVHAVGYAHDSGENRNVLIVSIRLPNSSARENYD